MGRRHGRKPWPSFDRLTNVCGGLEAPQTELTRGYHGSSVKMWVTKLAARHMTKPPRGRLAGL